jgi:hypothetical protein
MAAGDHRVVPRRGQDVDGAAVDIFPLATDAAALEALLRDLFCNAWDRIVFGPLVEGAAWEWRADGPPDRIGLFDGYLTVHFGRSHFHLCIGEHRGSSKLPVPAALARHRRTARAELFRRYAPDGSGPVSWGLRLFNGAGEQQLTIFLSNPFLSPDFDRVEKRPVWSRLDLWDRLRRDYCGLAGPDPVDRSARGFRHG